MTSLEGRADDLRNHSIWRNDLQPGLGHKVHLAFRSTLDLFVPPLAAESLHLPGGSVGAQDGPGTHLTRFGPHGGD